MSSHRSIQASVPPPRNRNFEAGTALDNLHAEMIDVEALAPRCRAAASVLPTPITERQRLVFG